MVDQSIKRAVGLTVVVVVVAKFASAAFDHWMGDTQDQMVENQQTLAAHVRGVAASQNSAQYQAIVAENCRKTMSVAPCSRPKDLHEAGECLVMLDLGYCDVLPRVNLCAAVEAIDVCADQFEDQKANGCDRLRRSANCLEKPAPESRENLWTFKFDDGLWQGED